MALNKRVLNENVDNVNRLSFAAFEKVKQESDELRKIGQLQVKPRRNVGSLEIPEAVGLINKIVSHLQPVKDKFEKYLVSERPTKMASRK